MESSWQCPLFRCFFVVTALTITSYVIRVLISVPFPFIATVSDAFGTLLPHHFNSKDFPAKFLNKVLQYGAEAKRPRFSKCESQTIGLKILAHALTYTRLNMFFGCLRRSKNLVSLCPYPSLENGGNLCCFLNSRWSLCIGVL